MLRPALIVCTLAFGTSSLAAKPAPTVELGLSEEALTAMLAAACPLSESIDGAAVGLPGGPALTVELTEPSVRVTNAAVKVTVRYRAKDSAGLIDLSGVAKPELRFVVVPAKGVIEARLVRLIIGLPGGLEVPLDASLAPFTLPAVWPAPVDLGGRALVAEVTVTEVVPETGRAVLRGELAFKPRKPDGKR